MIGDPLVLSAILAQICALAGVWAHLLARLARVEAQLDWLHEEVRRMRDAQATERARVRAL